MGADPLLILLALAVWLPTAGYFLALEIALRLRRPRSNEAGSTDRADPTEWPAVAVVLPVLDEAPFIDDRLRDFAGADYPGDDLELWVVDGGSRDDTLARVEAAMSRDPRIRLLRVEASRSKLEQVRLALEKVRAPVAVVSDADVALAPGCVRALVGDLVAHPEVGLVGAHVEPDTPLLEERLHWWLLDRLSWLEGEVLGAAGVAAPCYALRPDAVAATTPPNVSADDVHLGLIAQTRGWRVTRSRAARAVELRVPRSAAELLRFRRRRGGGFVREVRAFLARRGASARTRALVALRYLQLRIAPLGALALVAGTPWIGGAAAVTLAALGFGTAAIVWQTARHADAFVAERKHPWRLPRAGLRLFALDALALVVPGRGRPPAGSRR